MREKRNTWITIMWNTYRHYIVILCLTYKRSIWLRKLNKYYYLIPSIYCVCIVNYARVCVLRGLVDVTGVGMFNSP